MSSESSTQLDVTPFVEFEIPKYMGVWYEAMRYDNIHENEEKNNVWTYTETGKTEFRIDGKGKDKSGEPITRKGSAIVTGPGVFSVSVEGYPTSKYVLLGTDYESYACEFTSTEEDGNTVVYGWLLTRKLPACEEAVKKALAIYKKNGIDTSKFKKTYDLAD